MRLERWSIWEHICTTEVGRKGRSSSGRRPDNQVHQFRQFHQWEIHLQQILWKHCRVQNSGGVASLRQSQCVSSWSSWSRRHTEDRRAGERQNQQWRHHYVRRIIHIFLKKSMTWIHSFAVFFSLSLEAFHPSQVSLFTDHQ